MAQEIELPDRYDETSSGAQPRDWLAINEFPSTRAKNSAHIPAYNPEVKTKACKSIMRRDDSGF